MDFFVILFTFVLGLLTGGVGAIWLVAPIVGREEAHRALAWHLARRHIENIHAQARERMLAAVQAARQPATAYPPRWIVPAPSEPPTTRTFDVAERMPEARAARQSEHAAERAMPASGLTADEVQRMVGERRP